MHPLFDRKAWATRLRRLNFYRVVVVVVTPLVWLLFVVLGRRRAYFQQILIDCQVACFVECWTVAGKGNLIDTETPLHRRDQQRDRLLSQKGGLCSRRV
jgi:hypothetical protein